MDEGSRADREGMAYQPLVDLPLNQSRNSQLSCFGSGIESLVSFGSIFMKYIGKELVEKKKEKIKIEDGSVLLYKLQVF